MLDVAKALLIGIGICIGVLVLLILSYLLIPVALFVGAVLGAWFLLQILKSAPDKPSDPED